MLTSKDLLSKQKLAILIDTDSFDNFLSISELNTNILLEYSRLDFIDFVRTPGKTNHKDLEEIPAFTKEFENNKEIHSIHIESDRQKREIAFGYSMKDMKEIGSRIHGKQDITTEELESIVSIFVQAVLLHRNTTNIFITDKKALLKNRLWFESSFPGRPLNIVTLDEGKEIIDLFLKFHRKYHILASWLKVRLLRVFSSTSPIKCAKIALKCPNFAYSSIVSMGFARKLLAE